MMLDFHNHLMPGVDDGASNIDESRSGLKAMVADGVSAIITTPHFPASSTDRAARLKTHLEALDGAWDELTQMAADEFPAVRLERGVELMLDIPRPSLADERLRLAGTQFVLVEFPFMTIPPNSVGPLRELVAQGFIPVIAHPERYSNMQTNLGLVEQWRDAGAFLQGNSGSVVGRYGATAKRLIWRFFAEGSIEYLGSDYHSRGKCSVSECTDALIEAGGAAQLQEIEQNHERLLRNETPLEVSPLEAIPPEPLWKKLLRR